MMATVSACRNCERVRRLRPKGLCHRCYGDPAVRARYVTTSKYAGEPGRRNQYNVPGDGDWGVARHDPDGTESLVCWRETEALARAAAAWLNRELLATDGVPATSPFEFYFVSPRYPTDIGGGYSLGWLEKVNKFVEEE